jgi:pimeloyl-ACP methyl ester carboxylesterase
MPSATIEGCTLQYELLGDGVPVALTPGGREGMEVLDGLAEELASRHRVLQWDRRNAGSSEIFVGGESEQALWADDLAALLVRLDLAPAYIAGGSGGARVSVLTAIRHPEVVRGLILWSVSGGPYACQWLGYSYHSPFIEAAQRGGMEAVAETPFFAERIAANPVNRDRLLALDSEEFIRVMRRWNEFFYYRADCPTIGASEDELRAISVPTLVFGGNDDIHPEQPAREVARLIPGARLEPCAWSRDEFMDSFVGKSTVMIPHLYPRMVPTILEWLEQTEANG